MRAMLDEAVNHDGADDQKGQREGDDDVARDREETRNHAEQVCGQHEHEEREHEREEFHAVRAGGLLQGAGDEFMEHLGDGLRPARHDRPLPAREHQAADDQRGCANHEQGGVRESDGRYDGLDLELFDRARHDHSSLRCCLKSQIVVDFKTRHCFGSVRAGFASPAALNRLSIPAQNPRMMQTTSPQGDVPNSRSTMNPMIPPAATPEMNSAESLKAWPSAFESDVLRVCVSLVSRRCPATCSSRASSDFSRAERSASSELPGL